MKICQNEKIEESKNNLMKGEMQMFSKEYERNFSQDAHAVTQSRVSHGFASRGGVATKVKMQNM